MPTMSPPDALGGTVADLGRDPRGARHPAARPALLRAIKLTLTIHAAGTLWLAGWVWLG